MTNDIGILRSLKIAYYAALTDLSPLISFRFAKKLDQIDLRVNASQDDFYKLDFVGDLPGQPWLHLPRNTSSGSDTTCPVGRPKVRFCKIKQATKPTYKGIFRSETKVYYSNGSAYCQYKSRKIFQCTTGHSNPTFCPKKENLLEQLNNHGDCGIPEKCR